MLVPARKRTGKRGCHIESMNIKEEAHRIVDQLPENSTWDDLMHEIYVRQSVILIQYIQRKSTWTFPKMEKYTIKDFYPHPYEPDRGLWDGYRRPYGNKKARL
jgi:hypothetical protein